MRGASRINARKARVGDAFLIGGFALVAMLFFILQGERWQWHNPDGMRWIAAALTLLAWMGLVGWLRFRRQRAGVEAGAAQIFSRPEVSSAITLPKVADSEILVVHASQSGFAEQLAAQTLQSLSDGGVTARSVCIEALDQEALRAMDRVIFIASTTGEGDPPDVAVAFERVTMRVPAELSHLRVGLLALGDRDYDEFCGFGRRLWHWLQISSAQPLFDPVEVDRGDAAALRHWQHQLAIISGSGDLADWETPDYQASTLVERRLLNPGSLGAACFHLALQPRQHGLSWKAGDLVEIGPCHDADTVSAWLAETDFDGDGVVTNRNGQSSLAVLLSRCRLPPTEEISGLGQQALASVLQPLPHREYSIASIPDDGALHLLVREVRGAQGPGIGSAWLCRHAPIGADIALRVRSNPNFHAPVDARPLILIGNGTGLAALRSVIKARVACGHHRNWLLFGERQMARDFYYREEIDKWLLTGELERADFAWSRDQSERIYVQQRLREVARDLMRWVDVGAAIHVCGSLQGMAPGVDLALRDVLGAPRVEQLREEGRYRRDVY